MLRRHQQPSAGGGGHEGRHFYRAAWVTTRVVGRRCQGGKEGRIEVVHIINKRRWPQVNTRPLVPAEVRLRLHSPISDSVERQSMAANRGGRDFALAQTAALHHQLIVVFFLG